MSYTISTYNGQTTLATVADGTINTQYDITLIGKSYAGYGQALNENFVYLTQNFASATQPSGPLTGQIWYDTTHNKLKFYDTNNSWHTVGSSTTTSTNVSPLNLAIGDLWWDTGNNQLYAWNGTSSTLIGGSPTAASTQIVPSTVLDNTNVSHTVIQTQVNGETVSIISSDPVFTLGGSADSTYTGFTVINPGINLRYTNNSAQPGQTQSQDRFYGTATNSDRLGGLPAADYIQTTNASFSSQVNFSDAGYTVGSPVKLTVSNVGASTPTFLNSQHAIPTVFQTTLSNGSTVTPMQLLNYDVLPGVNGVSNLGSQTAGPSGGPLYWNMVYANSFVGTATQATTLNANGVFLGASVANTPSSSTIVARDSSGNINVTQMNGIATNANHLLDPATSTYISGSESATASTVAIRDSSGAIAATSFLNVGAAGTGTIGTSSHPFATVYANTFQGSFSGSGSTSAVNVISSATGSPGGLSSGSILVNVSTNIMQAATYSASIGAASSPSFSFIGDSGTGFYQASTGSGNINVANGGVYSGYFSNSGGLGNLTMTGKFYGTATSAEYADLAEKYLADADYDVGTVVSVGGAQEVTACTIGDRALGAVSANPAYMMNSELEGGTFIALKGRVPVKVTGPILKGQRLVAGSNGTAQVAYSPNSDVFAIALESNDQPDVKLVECVIL